jgi:hypothetical protein
MILLHLILFFLFGLKFLLEYLTVKYMYNIARSVGINGNTLSVGVFSAIGPSVGKSVVRRYNFLPTELTATDLA